MLRKLSEDQTVIIIVDELDRCLPAYTIKVLERLHHLFENVGNTQVIIAVDKSQLEQSIYQIYGQNTDVDGYLRKIISFEVKLDAGKISDEQKFKAMFKDYVEKFEHKEDLLSADEANAFITYILDGIDMRKRIALIDKCNLLHTLMGDKILDNSYLALELLLTLLDDYDIDLFTARAYFDINDVFNASALPHADKEGGVPAGLRKLSERVKEQQKEESCPIIISKRNPDQDILNNISLLGRLIMVYRLIIGFDDEWLDKSEESRAYSDYGTDYWNLLQSIH